MNVNSPPTPIPTSKSDEILVRFPPLATTSLCTSSKLAALCRALVARLAAHVARGWNRREIGAFYRSKQVLRVQTWYKHGINTEHRNFFQLQYLQTWPGLKRTEPGLELPNGSWSSTNWAAWMASSWARRTWRRSTACYASMLFNINMWGFRGRWCPNMFLLSKHGQTQHYATAWPESQNNIYNIIYIYNIIIYI